MVYIAIICYRLRIITTEGSKAKLIKSVASTHSPPVTRAKPMMGKLSQPIIGKAKKGDFFTNLGYLISYEIVDQITQAWGSK